MKFEYYNWSGITVQHEDTLVGFDLFGEHVTPEVFADAERIVLCLTHGHPEHAGSLRALIEAPETGPFLDKIDLISSADVVKHINQRGLLKSSNVHAVHPGQKVRFEGLEVTTFEWVHMPLLPPAFRDKVEYIFQLLLHPVDLVRIGVSGLLLPMNAPQLGFHLAFADGTTVLNYSEGVHRLTNPDEVARVSETLPAEWLLFAVEPDDTSVIPRWVEMLWPQHVIMYEAHRPWRDLFHLPFIDVRDYANQLIERFPEMRFSALTERGHSVTR